MSHNGDLGAMRTTYENAIKLLESRRRLARPKTSATTYRGLAAGSDILNDIPNVRGLPSLRGMKHWLQLLGHSDDDIKNLNVIHVAGTKGKGSTCAFVRSFLQAHCSRKGFPHKVGLYTSPHLRCIRERIQINSEPIVEEVFARYFFEVWDRLSTQTTSTAGSNQQLPRFLQLLALLAIHTFIREGADVTVMETYHGGEYDATNVIHQPTAAGITSIGLDHLAQLGPTIENVAWHKAGIFKPGTPAFCSPQGPTVSAVLERRAMEKGVALKCVKINESIPREAKALQSEVQLLNSSLALALVNSFLKQKVPSADAFLSKADIELGLCNFYWPGRFETVFDGPNKWFLDGAHNNLSIKMAAHWFSEATKIIEKDDQSLECHPPRVLIFTHISKERDGLALLQALNEALEDCQASPKYVIFTTYQERRDGKMKLDNLAKRPEAPFLTLPSIYSDFWKTAKPQATTVTVETIEEALEIAKTIGKNNGGINTLVTGSLHLVGGALNLLRPLD